MVVGVLHAIWGQVLTMCVMTLRTVALIGNDGANIDPTGTPTELARVHLIRRVMILILIVFGVWSGVKERLIVLAVLLLQNGGSLGHLMWHLILMRCLIDACSASSCGSLDHMLLSSGRKMPRCGHTPG